MFYRFFSNLLDIFVATKKLLHAELTCFIHHRGDYLFNGV